MNVVPKNTTEEMVIHTLIKLKNDGLISIKWAGDKIYMIVVNNEYSLSVYNSEKIKAKIKEYVSTNIFWNIVIPIMTSIISGVVIYLIT